jgi:hypothetical protein
MRCDFPERQDVEASKTVLVRVNNLVVFVDARRSTHPCVRVQCENSCEGVEPFNPLAYTAACEAV